MIKKLKAYRVLNEKLNVSVLRLWMAVVTFLFPRCYGEDNKGCGLSVPLKSVHELQLK